MPLVPFGDYRPDVSDYEGQATRNIGNVIPRGDGYGPFPGLSIYTSSLPSACRGAFYALKSDGTVVTFAGTLTGNQSYYPEGTQKDPQTLASDLQDFIASFGGYANADERPV